MKPKEAIKLLHPNTTKEAIRKIEENGGDAIKAIEEACVIACEALEKQVEKEPMPMPEKSDEYSDPYGCPICGACIWNYDFPFCSECGQKLKWGEDNDGKSE